MLRGRDKVYLGDAALPGAVLLLGRKLLQDAARSGHEQTRLNAKILSIPAPPACFWLSA